MGSCARIGANLIDFVPALEMACGEEEGRFPNRPYGLLGRSASTA